MGCPPSLADSCPPSYCHSSIRWLYDYWRERRPAPDMLPGRRHIDPLDFHRLWPWIWMVDVQPEPLRFRFRLIGSRHVALMQRDYSRQWLHEALPRLFGTPVTEGLEYAVVNRTSGYRRSPSYFRYKGKLHSAPHRMAERLFLPLAADGLAVNIVLALTMLDD